MNASTMAARFFGRVRLGQCSSKRQALHKIEHWAPKGARHFRLVSIGRDKSSAFDCRMRSPYFEIEVEYSARDERGSRPIPSEAYSDARLRAREDARWTRRRAKTEA